MTDRVLTIGHSTRAFDEVVGMLRGNGVTCLVDVRSFPSSRKHPQWTQAAVVEALPSDIGYRWIRELGGRRHTPAGVPSPKVAAPNTRVKNILAVLASVPSAAINRPGATRAESPNNASKPPDTIINSRSMFR